MNRTRLLDEDTRKHKQELVKAYIKHKSNKERHYTKLNELKVNQKWREILRKSKSKEFQREIEEMNKCFCQVLKHKDVMIEILQREHEEADRQHSLVTRQHLINMDKLIDSKAHRANLNQRDFKLKLELMKKKFANQLENLENTQTESLDLINQIRLDLEENHLQRETEIVSRYMQMEEDLMAMDRKDKFAMCNDMERKLNETWTELQTSLQQYLNNTKDSREVYERMKDRNEKCLQDIQEQRLTIENLNITIATLQQNITETRVSYEENVEIFKNEKEKLVCYAKKLKSLLKKTKTDQQNTLKKLAVESEHSIEVLREICDMGNSIMKMHSQCERLERTNLSLLDDDENLENVALENVKDYHKVLDAMTFFETDEVRLTLLENFWNNYNLNVLRNKKLENDIQLLTIKNEELQLELKKTIYGLDDGVPNIYAKNVPR